MSELIKQLVAEGILSEDHGFADEAAVFGSLKSALIERNELKSKIETSGKSETDKTVEATASKPKPADSQSAYSVEAARSLVQAGFISKGEDGRWSSKTTAEQGFADALNAHEVHVQQRSGQALELLATDPGKFAEEYLGDYLKNLREEITEQVNGSVKSQLGDVVRAPSQADLWYEANKADLEADDSPLKKAYQEIYRDLEQQNAPLRETLGEKGFQDYLHNMTGPQAELRALQSAQESTATDEGGEEETSTQVTGDSTSDQGETTVTENRSLVDQVNDGEEIEASGERNNGTNRALNEHARQIGDTSEPVTSQGRVNFMALADESAQKLGIK